MSDHGPTGQADACVSGAGRLTHASIVASEPQLTRWRNFEMVVKVVELRLRFIALMAVTGLVFAYWDTLWNYYEKWTRPPGHAHVAALDTEYLLPDASTVIQAEPDLVPNLRDALSKRKKG